MFGENMFPPGLNAIPWKKIQQQNTVIETRINQDKHKILNLVFKAFAILFAENFVQKTTSAKMCS